MGEAAGDGGGTGGDAGDGGAFSPLPGAVCDFALTLDDPVLRSATLADLLANGSRGAARLAGHCLPGECGPCRAAGCRRSRLQSPVSQWAGETHLDHCGCQWVVFPEHPARRARLCPLPPRRGWRTSVLARFVPARQTWRAAPGADSHPGHDRRGDGRDERAAGRRSTPCPSRIAFLADIAPLQILLPDHPNGNGKFATVQLLPGEPRCRTPTRRC